MQKGKHYRYLIGNIIFDGILECKTGLHIGGSSDVIEIGGIDSPVIRNPLTNEPYIPGSSFKGKLRSIVEKIVVDKNGSPLIAQRHAGDKEEKVWRHECDDFKDAVECSLCRIFGSTGKNSQNNNYPGSLLVRDCDLNNKDELKDDDLPILEAKMENCLDRLTSSAHPRCVERVPAGAIFNFELVYRIECMGEIKENNKPALMSPHMKKDIENIITALEILEHDGIGGNISRGYGQVKFQIDKINAINNRGETKYSKEKIELGEAKKEIESLSKAFDGNVNG